MPLYVARTWSDYKIGLLPYDDKKIGYLWELWHYYFMPIFNGPRSFDLVIKAPTKKAIAVEQLRYKWTWEWSEKGDYSGTAARDIHEDSISFVDTLPSRNRKVKDSDTTHYLRRNTLSWKTTTFSKVRAVDLGWLSKLGQYRITMEFIDNNGQSSGNMILLEFTVVDHGEFQLNTLNIIIGALFGGLAGAVTGALVALLFGIK